MWVTADRFDGVAGPATAHWDGTSWTEHLNPGGTGALIAVSTTDVFGFGANVTHWNGTSWSVFDDLGGLPGASLHASELTTDGDMWAVGRFMPGDEIQTLTVRADDLRPPLVTGTTAEPTEGDGVLSGPFPNPIRGRARFTLEVVDPGPVSVTVFDALGRVVAALHDGVLDAGTHEFSLDATALPPGAYVVRAVGVGFVAVRRAVVRS